MITLAQFQSILAGRKTDLPVSDLYASLVKVIKSRDLDTPMRTRHFLAQACAETIFFTALEETLYYTTPGRIVDVWPSRFTLLKDHPTKKFAGDYLKNEEKLANAVYGNRGGNGPTKDALKYRGRGATHLTFLDNYRECSLAVYGDDRLVKNPDLVAQDPDVVWETFGWYWDSRKLSPLAEKDEFTLITSKINGASGKNLVRVVEERKPYLKKVRSVLG